MTISHAGNDNLELSLVWVHYHTPELLAESISKATQDLKAASINAELIVVDNGGLPDQSNPFLGHKVTVLHNDKNLGYAGGINRGIATAKADKFLVLNPDVLIEPGCIRRLIDALQQTDVVAPTLYLDRGRHFKLPVNERRDFVSAVLRELAQGSDFFAGLARNRWRRHVQGAAKSAACFELSGAVLCFTRSCWESVGPWDEGYRLYFEESDWLQRVRAGKHRARLEPGATAIHLYAQSTRNEPQSNTWFNEGIHRYEQLHYPGWQRWLLKKIRQKVVNKGASDIADDPGNYPDKEPISRYIELSDSAIGFPAAVLDLETNPDFGEEDILSLVEELPNAEYRLRWVTDNGVEVSSKKI